MMHGPLSVCFVILCTLLVTGSFDVNKYKTLAKITRNTKVVDLFLDHNRVFLSALGNSTPFTYPVGCSPTQRRFLEQYCVVGTYTAGGNISIALDLHIYDANDNTKTVLLGMTASFNGGDPNALASRASGCAYLYDQTLSYGTLRGVVHACMSGGGTGEYDPVTKQYTVSSNISSNMTVRGFGRDLINDNYTLQGYYHAGADFDMGMNATVGSKMKKDGIYAGNLSFDVSFGTVANNLFAWHAFAGIHASASYPFVDIILNVKP